MYRFSRFIFLVILKLFFQFEVKGRENIPEKGGFILAANHVSYLDPAAVGVACPRTVHFMARDSLFLKPVLKSWLKAVEVIPLKRNAADLSAIKTGLKILRKGGALALFPEGTRRTKVDMYLNPEPGVGFLAAKGGVPVIPAFVSGTYIAMPRQARSLRLAKISVRFGKEIHIERGRPYQETSDLIMANIKQLSNN
ncbi:MAG: lysophospholipid acyltransferase family protein [Candidatus Omnitrophica bacterium]|nr:lysophospholipid acyltransferase family protein [Candidatus Omnitrophota bacterium]